MLEYHRVSSKQIKPLSPEPQLSDFHHRSDGQKNSEILFVTVSSGLATYAIYKYLKQKEDKKLNETYYQPNNLWTGSKAIK